MASPLDADRLDDGYVSSAAYARASAVLRDDRRPQAIRIDYHHPLEKWVRLRPFRWLLGFLSADGASGRTRLQRILESYRNPQAPWTERVKFVLAHRFIDHMRGSTDVATFRARLTGHRPTIRGLVVVARSLAKLGLTVPQRFVSPLFAVWNFTNRCNLACRHCYQDSRGQNLAHELSLQEKLDLVDQMGRLYLPMLALSGGEPTVSPDLLAVIERACRHDMHVSLATNGTALTPALAARLAEAGLRYVEISLDSVDPARHDAFRGVRGMWQCAVAGAEAVAATPGLRLGIAMCVHQGNFDEVADMIDLAASLGAGCFAHFNFIPVGRGAHMAAEDLTPAQREQLLGLLNERMQRGEIGIISTAPQLGRVCLAGSALEDGRTICSHAGSGSGVKARVVAKYLGGCGAGRTYVSIQPNGDVTPCVYLPHRVMGNVRHRPLVDIFRQGRYYELLNDRTQRLHHCRVCAFRDYCGGCRARSDAYFGRLDAADPGCLFNQKHWERLAGGRAAAQDQNPAGASCVQ
jgi:radical SAM protein with 4Fe4S-binding SPASM domain